MYSIIPYSRREANLFRFMDDIENSLFNNTVSGREQFRCDISEKNGEYLLEAELPGFDKKDINVAVDGDLLTISATHEENNEETDGKGNFVRRERRFGSYSRSFSADGIDVDNIKADYKNGVLSLELPKAKETKPETRQVAIGS